MLNLKASLNRVCWQLIVILLCQVHVWCILLIWLTRKALLLENMSFVVTGVERMWFLFAPSDRAKKTELLAKYANFNKPFGEGCMPKGVVFCVAIWIEQQFETQMANVGYKVKFENDWWKVAARDDRILTCMNSRCVGQTERKC